MVERKVAYKTVEKFIKDKRTQEKVLKRFVYVDMERASQSEKEIIQMLVSSGYEVKKWNSLKKTSGIKAEVIYQYFKEKIKNAKDDNEKKIYVEAKDKLVDEIKANVNFMTILQNFNSNFIKTKEDKQYLDSIKLDTETVETIGALKVEKIRIRKIRENDKRLVEKVIKENKNKEADAKMTKETSATEESVKAKIEENNKVNDTTTENSTKAENEEKKENTNK